MKARFVPGSATLAKPYTVEELGDSLSTNFQIDRLRAAHPLRLEISGLGDAHLPAATERSRSARLSRTDA